MMELRLSYGHRGTYFFFRKLYLVGKPGWYIPSTKPTYIMYTDKINPDHPEGRLLISSGRFHLKDPSLPTSSVPLCDKAETLFNYLEDNNFETLAKQRMKKSYADICQNNATRNIDRYSCLLQKRPSERKFLSWWLLFDYYDMLPNGCRVNFNSAYYRLNRYYQSLIDRCMEAGLKSGLRETTVSAEASMAASFFEYLYANGVEDISCLTEKIVRDFTRTGRCEPLALYRISLFLRRYADDNKDELMLSVLHYFPKEVKVRKIYEPFTHKDRETLESFILSQKCPLRKRDRAIIALILYTGMRGCDVTNLKLSDIDWVKNTIKFKQGKTLGDVILPLRPVVGNFIYEYISSERPECGSEYCFVSIRPHSGKYHRVSVPCIINRAYDLCGIRQDGIRKGAHLLRHSLADEMVNEGNDVTMVSKTLGHLSPTTSLGYMSSNIEQLRACALSIEPYPVTHILYSNE